MPLGRKGHAPGTIVSRWLQQPVLVACTHANHYSWSTSTLNRLRACPREKRRYLMTDTVLQSFCERCGTRYTFSEPEAKPPEESRTRRGWLGRRAPEEAADPVVSTASPSSEQFAGTFHFCMDCRQYTCTKCWNPEAGGCLSCRPPYRAGEPAVDAAAATSPFAAHDNPSTWPSDDLGRAGGAADPTPASTPRQSDTTSNATELDEWGRPRRSEEKAEEPTSDAPAVADFGARGADLDPWRGVAFTEEEVQSSEPESPPPSLDLSSRLAARSSPGAWPDSDRPAEAPPTVVGESKAWREGDRVAAVDVSPARESEPEPAVAPQPAPEPVPEPVVAPEPEPVPEPVVVVKPEPEPEPVVAPVVAPQLAPEPEPDPTDPARHWVLGSAAIVGGADLIPEEPEPVETTPEGLSAPPVEHDTPATVPAKPEVHFEEPPPAEPMPAVAPGAPEPETATPVEQVMPSPIAPEGSPPSIEIWNTPTEPGPFSQPYQAPAPIPPEMGAPAQPPAAVARPQVIPQAPVKPPPPPHQVPAPPQQPPVPPPAPRSAPRSAPPPQPPPPPQVPAQQQPAFVPPPAPPAPTTPPARPRAVPRPRTSTHACASCGLSLSAKARFCRRCGAPQA